MRYSPARAFLDDVNVIGEFVFSNWLLPAPFAIGKELVDVLLCVAKRLAVLFRESIGDVLRE